MPQPRLLIIDDEQETCSAIERAFKRRGYVVQTAFTGKTGLQAFHAFEPHIVLLDISLPDGNGVEIAKEMIQKRPQTPIILISAFGTIPSAVEATKHGVYDFIEKPFDRDRLELTIRNALALEQSREELVQYKHDCLKQFKMIGHSPAIRNVYNLIHKIAPTDSPVLITGEAGVGKELIAQAIHDKSSRSTKPLVKLNCAAIPENLIESELFGHAKGAYTGASLAHNGRIMAAAHGTLFLDEIGDLSLPAQAKILRFLENGEIQRVGSTRITEVDTRIVAATNQDLETLVETGKFRHDLLYRLDVFSIHAPTLRERREDILPLIHYFIEQYANEEGVIHPRLSQSAEQFLVRYDWPGNIRQLQHFVRRMIILSDYYLIEVPHVKLALKYKEPAARDEEPVSSLREAVREFERTYIQSALVSMDGNLTKTAHLLQMDKGNLSKKMQNLGLRS